MINIDTYGIRETLAELRRYEPETYKELSNNLKNSAMPAAQAVGRMFPDEPLRNWHTSGGRKGESRFPPYSGSKAKTSVKPMIILRKPQGINQHGLFRLQQQDAGGSVYDTAGSATAGGRGRGASAAQKFVANLDKHSNIKSSGTRYRSRIMYGASEKYLPLIEAAVEVQLAKINVETQKRLNG
jgi:hypothetical protein